MARFVALVILLTTLSCAERESVRVIKLAHGLPTSHPVHAAMEFFAKRVGARSGGKLRVDVHPAEQLGTERESLELLQLGAVGMRLRLRRTPPLRLAHPLLHGHRLP